jgi:hypothetical protein
VTLRESTPCERPGGRRRPLIVGMAFALVTVVASLLVARRLTDSSWPLDHAEPALVAAAAVAYLASLFFRARAWHRLFPRSECPDQARCLASVGAAEVQLPASCSRSASARTSRSTSRSRQACCSSPARSPPRSVVSWHRLRCACSRRPSSRSPRRSDHRASWSPGRASADGLGVQIQPDGSPRPRAPAFPSAARSYGFAKQAPVPDSNRDGSSRG